MYVFAAGVEEEVLVGIAMITGLISNRDTSRYVRIYE